MSSQTFKQRGGGPPKSDRNANEENHHQQQQEAAEKLQQELLPLPQLGAKPKSQRENKSQRILQTKTENQNQNQRQKAQSLQGYGNYMELEFIQAEAASSATFDDLPVSYATTSVAPVAPPPYREPPPPTPPPLSQIPSRESRLLHSAPNTPIRGKVVLSKKERKELSKQLGLEDLQGLPLGGSTSAQSSPYKGRVSELKNCIARGLFATLHRGTPKERELHINQEISPPPPAPESGNNNEDAADYSEKLKNLPVRQRKVATRHMDNYCLFDPVDFINDKAMRYPSATTSTSTSHGLRDPLFSSRQHLVCEDEDEMVPEVIYDNEELELEETIIIETSALPEAETEGCAEPKDVRIHFDHHNYFVIEPGVCTMDIGIPNPYTNEQLVNANLEQQNLEKLFQELENPASMSNSQESKDTETTSTALVESSTSTNSGSSMGSTSIQNQAQHSMKKKLTFLNLSPFRGGKKSGDKSTFEQQQRAISELVSTDHMLHLQQLLQEQRRDQRSHTVPVPTESNYVLFNPGPVPSRHVQYKIRRSRPLSTHSDADSGFLSPCSPDEMRGNPAILVLQQCDSVQGYIERRRGPQAPVHIRSHAMGQDLYASLWGVLLVMPSHLQIIIIIIVQEEASSRLL
ncbi:GL26325 [Drosophila persimilis]|uniref:GL26325 n=1 Tax=Drosophila persimilis TaxID=7234 RepID=B4GS68_DROPE|nr:GL26325 [Drosophila persimilis]